MAGITNPLPLTQTEFHGRGAAYPLEASTTGGVRESSGARKVEESVRIILGTQHGERVMRPTFGCNLRSLVFAPNNDATANLARHYVEDGLRRWEPRIEVMDVRVDNGVDVNRRGQLIINITFRLRATGEVQSMVYPFYLERP
jgi:phage baseplate assembly protein W